MKTQCNQKCFCLNCNISFKIRPNSTSTICPNCHTDSLMHISYKARAPKVKASKKKWKEFFNEIKYALKWYRSNHGATN